MPSVRSATLYDSGRDRNQFLTRCMTYVSAVLRIQAGGVEPFRYRKVGMLLCQLYVRSPRPQLLLPRGFHAKAAFVTASTAIDTLHMICMPLPSKRQILGRRSRMPVSCARCLVLARPLFARVREAASAKWRHRHNLTSSFRTKASGSLALSVSL